MKNCILSAVIAVILTNDSCADERTNQNNLITTYDPGESPSETPIRPRLSSYGEITADDQADHYHEQHGRIRFEDQTTDRPIRFKDGPKEQELTNIDQIYADSVHADVSLGDRDNSDTQRLHKFRSESADERSGNKIKFEGSNTEIKISNDQEDDYDEYPQRDSSQVIFENYGKFDEDNSKNSDYEVDAESKKPIKFENHSNNPSSENKNADFSKNTVNERVAFRDDSNRYQEPVRKKKRKPRKKPGYQTLPGNPVPMDPNSLHLGLDYSGYPGYPGPVYPNSEYPGYAPPGYPSSYPGMTPPITGYPGYPPYPGSLYQPMGQGYGLYPASEYQGPGEQRPPINPNPGQSDQSGNTDTRYPSHGYADSPSSVATQIGKPVPSHPGPKYPYYQGYPVPGYAQAYPSGPNSQYSVQSQTQYRLEYPGVHQPGYQSGHYKPSRRPKSLPQRAVSAVAEALTSIALYDDQQCVPRLLCEVAGGSSASSSSSLLKATAGLQPLLTVLQAYNGASSSPLFVFGRAAVMGVTSKGNPSACRYAYPQCPNDPEKLLNYLNNHNGGFFRFFGQPELPQQPQNLEQFYNYLSGQNSVQSQQNYSNARPGGYGFQTQNPYVNLQQYGAYYNREQNSFRISRNNESEIEARIQNKPSDNVLDDDNDLSAIEDHDRGPKWLFPDEGNKNQDNYGEKIKIKQERPSKGSKTLKFPDDKSSDDRREIYKPRDYVRKQKSIFFPGERYSQFKRPIYQTTTPVNPQEYEFDHKHNFYVRRPTVKNNDDVVYVVRGNGDPNHPEIIKVKPGQSVF